MNSRKAALALAAQGYFVFPLVAGGKVPQKDMAFKTMSSNDPDAVKELFTDDETGRSIPANVGVYCGRFGDNVNESLCVIDVDTKPGQRGAEFWRRINLLVDIPETRTQTTASGGKHYVFRTYRPVANSVSRLGAPDRDTKTNIDVRGVGGFFVGAGSQTEKGEYTTNDTPIAELPDELYLLCGAARPERESDDVETLVELDSPEAVRRAIRYLQKFAPESIKGQGGDATAIMVANQVLDYGVSVDLAVELMMDHWHDGSGWSEDKLSVKVAHAAKYRREAIGVASTDAEGFTAIEVPGGKDAQGADVDDSAYTHPVNKYNRHHAWVLIGGEHYVLWETTNAKGKSDLRILSERSFHAMYSADKMAITIGDKTRHEQCTKLWFDAPGTHVPPKDDSLWRRSYRGMAFSPANDCPPDFYNTWRGFAVEALSPCDVPKEGWVWALNAWREHILQNICRGNTDHAHWLTSWFAHLVQKPGIKPLVACVFYGDKGTGKNSAVERVVGLLGRAGMVTAEKRYVFGNFNGHLDGLLLFVLDEAAWAGDKPNESVLKSLITGTTHTIERKGKETYDVDNLLRIAFIGNERWVVPASGTERRFAVFHVGNGRQKDMAFFERMRLEMEDGGYRLLLRFLLDYDMGSVNVNDAPVTEGLLEQKIESLEPFLQWWHESLVLGYLASNDFGNTWPEQVSTDQLGGAVERYFKRQQIRSRAPSRNAVQKLYEQIGPSVRFCRLAKGKSGAQPYVYRLPPLDVARTEFATHLGHDISWES